MSAEALGPTGAPLPALRLAGASGAGKTAFGTRLVAELRRRGRRVAVLKHAAKHRAPPDVPGKDTQRYREAGAAAVAGAFHDEAVIRLPADGVTAAALIGMLAGVADLVIVEGYHEFDLPTLYVGDAASGRRFAGETLLAVVSDAEPADPATARLAPGDAAEAARFVERWLMTGESGGDASR